jgi:hypothetical protein
MFFVNGFILCLVTVKKLMGLFPQSMQYAALTEKRKIIYGEVPLSSPVLYSLPSGFNP